MPVALAPALALLFALDPDPAAVRLTHKATAEYNAGEFGQAVLDYESAYNLAPIPELIFDMAQCQRGLHHWGRAEGFYRRYLHDRPNARNRPRVEELIVQMEAKRKAEGAAPAPEAQAAQPPATEGPSAAAASDLPELPADATAEPTAPKDQQASQGGGIPTGTWVLGSLGGACLLGAGGLGLAVLLQPDQQTVTGGLVSHSLTYPQLQAIHLEGSTAVGLAIGGVVLLGAGVIWGLVAQ